MLLLIRFFRKIRMSGFSVMLHFHGQCWYKTNSISSLNPVVVTKVLNFANLPSTKQRRPYGCYILSIFAIIIILVAEIRNIFPQSKDMVISKTPNWLHAILCWPSCLSYQRCPISLHGLPRSLRASTFLSYGNIVANASVCHDILLSVKTVQHE